MNTLTVHDIDELTRQYGDGWGYAHVRRVLALIGLIGGDLAHDSLLLTYAAYLHDWGAFPHFRQQSVDHALRSRQVAEEMILPRLALSAQQQAVVLEAIELHDYRNQQAIQSPEALLLREADWLDMLGVIGVVREFAWGPNNLQLCYERVLARMAGIRPRLTLPTAQSIAQERLAEMEYFLQRLDAESFGFL